MFVDVKFYFRDFYEILSPINGYMILFHASGQQTQWPTGGKAILDGAGAC